MLTSQVFFSVDSFPVQPVHQHQKITCTRNQAHLSETLHAALCTGVPAYNLGVGRL